MSSRSKKQFTTPIKQDTLATKRVESSWVMLIKEPLFENDNFSIITLPRPGHSHLTKYCLDFINKKMYEVVTFNEDYRSWFIGETVKSDGSLLLATPVNPIFLVLPRLREHCANKAIPLEDLLSEKGFNQIIDFTSNLDNVADLKGSQEMRAYKYNEEKTLKWLESKVRKLAVILRQKNVHVTSGAVSATFVASNIGNDNIDEEFYLRYALGIISDYLQEDLAELLGTQFNFKPELVESIGKKRKSEADCKDSSKRIKSENCENSFTDVGFLTNTFSEVKKAKPLTSKEKARQKAASGTKTLSSFFTKK